MRPVILASGCLLSAILCLAGMIEADSAGAVGDGTWKALGGVWLFDWPEWMRNFKEQ